MSIDVSDSFITQYERDVHHAFQRRGSALLQTVRRQSGVVGSTCVFQVIGKGTATTKARHGSITPMNQTHTTATATLADFYAGDWSDRLDEDKLNIDERGAIAEGGANALGRKADDQLTTAMDGTTQTVKTITVSSIAATRVSVSEWVEALDVNDVPNDGQRYAVVSPRMWHQMEQINQFASLDYVGADGLPFVAGAPLATEGSASRFRRWMNVLWIAHSGVPGRGTATAKMFMYHKSAVGYASGPTFHARGGGDVTADITWHGDRAAHFINHMMSGGAVLIDDTGVVEANLNDTTAIPTS